MVLALALAAGIGAMALVSPAAAQEYRCHVLGERYAQSEIACIGGRVARCGMYLNNSSWKMSADTCTPGTNPRAWTPEPRQPEPRSDADPAGESER